MPARCCTVQSAASRHSVLCCAVLYEGYEYSYAVAAPCSACAPMVQLVMFHLEVRDQPIRPTDSQTGGQENCTARPRKAPSGSFG